MTIRVNGHILPPALVRLIKQGFWGSGCRGDYTRLPIEDKDDLALLDVAAMIENTDEVIAAWNRGEGHILALTDSKSPTPGLLAVDMAVVIAATRSQEALVLDYSAGDPPRVVASAGSAWVEVARNVEDLFDLIGPASNMT